VPKVTIRNKENKLDYERPIKLHNGDLVLLTQGNDIVREYLVIPFRGTSYNGHNRPNNYCSFIDLQTGTIQFTECCSRNTTVKRVLKHLNIGEFNSGFDLRIFNPKCYEIELTLLSQYKSEYSSEDDSEEEESNE
jgi:hypothetical protein